VVIDVVIWPFARVLGLGPSPEAAAGIAFTRRADPADARGSLSA
jgi:hypothetical protein